ncbi:MAG: hypothetical protein K6A34_07080, partial [Methanobrevibacter sp.]|nr:hypothetical protein [Methanobrevibacter sp.]
MNNKIFVKNIIQRANNIHHQIYGYVLNSLCDKKLIDFMDSIIKVIDSDKEINTVNSKKDLEELELNIKEK